MSVPSPCISVCRMSIPLALVCGEPAAARHQGLCEGCLRSMDEIATWGGLTDPQKMQVLQRIEQRMAQRRLNRST